MKSTQTKKIVLLSLFIAIEVLLAVTPLGFIAIGPIRSTTLHIPVILAGILLGYKEGLLVGLTFGLLSVMMNTFAPTPASFVFSPFYEFAGVSGNGASLIIALVPRMLLGLSSAFFFRLLSNQKDMIKIVVASGLSSMMHTVLVMVGIYVFFGPQYAMIREVDFDQLVFLLFTIITTNGIIEMMVGILISWGVYRVLKPMVEKRKIK